MTAQVLVFSSMIMTIMYYKVPWTTADLPLTK